MTTHDATAVRFAERCHRLLNFTPSQVATWSATSKRSLPPQVPLQRGPGSDLMCGHPRRRPFPGVGRKVREELEYDGMEYAALPVGSRCRHCGRTFTHRLSMDDDHCDGAGG